ncbi:MAG: BamA/TamA family outer membrane protein [Planctomycetota bacterium]
MYFRFTMIPTRPRSEQHYRNLLQTAVSKLPIGGWLMASAIVVASAGCQSLHQRRGDKQNDWLDWPGTASNVEHPEQAERLADVRRKSNSSPSTADKFWSDGGPPVIPASATGTASSGGSTSNTRKIRGQSPDDSVNRYAQSPNYPPIQQGELPTFPSTTSEATLPRPPAIQSPAVAPKTGGSTSAVTGPSGIGSTTYPSSGAVSSQPSPLSGAAPQYGYNSAGATSTGPFTGSPSDYGSTLAPGASAIPQSDAQAIAPGVIPYVDPNVGITAPAEAGFRARERIAPVDVYVQEARTGRIILGGSVNSDLGVAGQLIIDERNFNIRRWPRSFEDIRSGRAWKGAGQNFRMELMPGNRVERYTVSWTERNLLGYLPYSLSVGGFYYTRQFRDWTEQRLGGRVALGYEVTKDLSVSSEIRMEDVKLFDPRINGVADLESALGSNDIYTARFRVARDTRDSPFMSTRGSLLELTFDQVFGEYDFSRGRVNYSRYFMVKERPDGTGRHVLASTWRLGFTGAQTPIFENFYAGGYSTLRGFSFRGAGPVVGDVQVGGEFMALGSLEYVFPLTADDMLRGVAFVDYGTVEENIDLNSENFRVAPGLGLRVTVPALGPAPLAFDFAYPLNHADTDDRQVFSFFMGFTR